MGIFERHMEVRDIFPAMGGRRVRERGNGALGAVGGPWAWADGVYKGN